MDFDKKVTIIKSIRQKRKEISIAIGVSWCDNIHDIDKCIISADTAMLKDKEKNGEEIDECVNFFKDGSEKILLKEINHHRF